MREELFAEYVCLDLEFKVLEERRERLRKDIFEEMVRIGKDKVSTDYGKFAMAKRLIWSYPKKITDLEERLELAKVDAQKRGKATFTERPYLAYSKNKIQ